MQTNMHNYIDVCPFRIQTAYGCKIGGCFFISLFYFNTLAFAHIRLHAFDLSMHVYIWYILEYNDLNWGTSENSDSR